MSWVTNTILHFTSMSDEEERYALEQVNSFFTQGPGHGRGFVSVKDPSPPGWYGGGKALECSLAIGAFNHLDIDALVEHLCKLCAAGTLHDTSTQLLLRDQEDDKFRIINIDEEMRARGMRAPWGRPEEAQDR